LRKLRDLARSLFTRRNLYRECFATEAGKYVLRDLFHFCNVSRPVLVPGDPGMTGFNDGLRRVALRIAKQLNMSDDEILRLANQAEEGLHDES
jgi:hypothetical protein